MKNTETPTVLSNSPDSNVFTMHGVDMLKSIETNRQGRVYTSETIGGEAVKFALKTEGEIENKPSSENLNTVELIDVDYVDHGEVYKNGHLHLGKEYANTEVVIALKLVDGKENINEQTTGKPTVHG
jgi:hypothetical protein